MPCPYANIFGEPGQGIHSTRILGMAVIDWLATVIIAILISWIFRTNLTYTLLVLFVVGELLHYFLGVNTAVLKMSGVRPLCD